jgi:UDP-2,4-diacetamido-2,4,6-trideoxy-beta-L-altropyranose hydrolase
VKKIIFRADGNAQIGLGHVMRCLALSEMLGSDYDRRFAIVQPTPEVARLIQDLGIAVVALPKPPNDLAALSVALDFDDVLVLDGYAFDKTYQQSCRGIVDTLVYIDDLCEPDPIADVIINHAGGAKQADYYPNNPFHYREKQLLLGNDYALIRQPFLQAAQQYRSDDHSVELPFKKIFVNLGGADPGNYSWQVVNALLLHNPNRQITLILGSANPHRNTFSQFSSANLLVLTSLSADAMVEAIRQCDVAVVSCSTISYEVALLRRPFVGILTADNQVALAKFYVKEELTLAVLSANFAPYELEAALATTPEKLKAIKARQHKYFDGLSGERLATVFRNFDQY